MVLGLWPWRSFGFLPVPPGTAVLWPEGQQLPVGQVTQPLGQPAPTLGFVLPLQTGRSCGCASSRDFCCFVPPDLTFVNRKRKIWCHILQWTSINWCALHLIYMPFKFSQWLLCFDLSQVFICSSVNLFSEIENKSNVQTEKYIFINMPDVKCVFYKIFMYTNDCITELTFFPSVFSKGEIRSCYLKAGCQKEGNFRHQLSNCDCMSNAQ